MSFNIGVGKYDITGPCTEIGFMGMSNMGQTGSGIHSKLFSRAFVIEENDSADPSANHRIAYVIVNLAICTLTMKAEVIKKLKAYDPFTTGGKCLYTDENVIITAEHTHCGPGGYSQYLVYNASIIGFSEENFDCITEGIFQSIRIAHENKRNAKILMAKGIVEDCGGNRSLPAYMNNPESERKLYNSDTDKEMVLLKFVDENGIAFGSINWFAVHPTNMGETMTIISPDNKGYAEYLFEKKYPGVISAFANSCCGDVSPNMKYGVPDGIHDIERTYIFGEKQYLKACELFENAAEIIDGKIDYRLMYTDMSNCHIEGTNKRTWPAAFGFGMVNGSQEDSKGMGSKTWGEGTTKHNIKDKNNVFIGLAKWFIGIMGVHWPDGDDFPPGYNGPDDEKPIILHIGLASYKNNSIIPSILPLQQIKIGPLLIASHPGELTTMSGRRMRKTLQDIFGSDDVKHIILATYANAYSSYTTTKEEYDTQNYEGASTLFGPYQLEAYQQEQSKIARALKNNQPLDKGPEPIILPKDAYIQKMTRRIPDEKIQGLDFGDLEIQPKSSYKRGEKVEVTFLGGYPGHNLKINDTYTAVERKVNNSWERVYTDVDFCTFFNWHPREQASMFTVTWNIPTNEQVGTYRICYFGHRYEFPRKTYPITGISKEFKVG